MSREQLQESLSAAMDNEAEALELHRILASSEENPELRASWMRYQIARSAMHREPQVPGIDISAAVRAALADEPVVSVQAESASPARGGPWRTHVARFAVAASVTAAVLVGVRFYNADAELAPELASNQPPLPSVMTPAAPAVLASYATPLAPVGNAAAGVSTVSANAPEGSAVQWHEQRLPSYLRQHAQQAAMGAEASTLPFARAASFEER